MVFSRRNEEILTIDREPEEDFASQESTSDFISPLVVESHPCRPGVHLGWLNIIPELWLGEVPVSKYSQLTDDDILHRCLLAMYMGSKTNFF